MQLFWQVHLGYYDRLTCTNSGCCFYLAAKGNLRKLTHSESVLTCQLITIVGKAYVLTRGRFYLEMLDVARSCSIDFHQLLCYPILIIINNCLTSRRTNSAVECGSASATDPELTISREHSWFAAGICTTVIPVLSSASNGDCIIQANKCPHIIREGEGERAPRRVTAARLLF